MSLTLDFNVQLIIFLEFSGNLLLSPTHLQLYFVLIRVRSASLPAHILYQIVLRHIYGSASQPQPNNEPFGGNLLSLVMKVKVHETLNNRLLQFFAFGACFVDELNLFLKLCNLVYFKLFAVDAHFQLFMDDLVSKSAHGRGEMSVKVQVQPEMALVGVQMARVNSILLDVDCLIKQQLFPAIVKGLFLKEQFELVLEMHHVVSFEFYTKVRNIAIQMFNVAVKRFWMVDYERICSEIFYKFFCHLVVSHNHELFHNFLSFNSFLKTYVFRESLFIQLEDNLVSIKNITMTSCLPSIFGQLLHYLQLLLQLFHLQRRQLFILHKFSLISLVINYVLSLLIRQLGYTSDHGFLEPRRNDFSL